MSLIKKTIEGNKARKIQMANRIFDLVKNIQNAQVGILGLAFKNGTDDVRESPAMEIVTHLLEKGVYIKAFDYKANQNAQKIFGTRISYADTPQDVFENADVVAVLTEWPEFKNLDLISLSKKMRHKKMADLRNLFDPQLAENAGFEYVRIGK